MMARFNEVTRMRRLVEYLAYGISRLTPSGGI